METHTDSISANVFYRIHYIAYDGQSLRILAFALNIMYQPVLCVLSAWGGGGGGGEGIMITLGVVQYIRYHDYIERCAVHWKDTMINVRGIVSSLGDVRHIWIFHTQ